MTNNKDRVISEIVEKVLQVSPKSISQILDKGITNEVFIVDLSDSKVILRISPEPNTSQFEKEQWEMEEANKLGIQLPKVISVGNYCGTIYMILEYIEGLHGTDPSLNRRQIWKQLGTYEKLIHSVPTDGFGDHMISPGKFNGKWQDYIDYDIQSLTQEDKLIEMGVLTLKQSEKIKKIFEHLRDEHFTFGLCHGDLSLKNVISNKDDKVFLLDWGSSESQIVPHFDIVEVLQSSFHFDFHDKNFLAFINGCGLSEEEFMSIKPNVDALILLRAVDRLRWALDKKPSAIEHFRENLNKILNYLEI